MNSTDYLIIGGGIAGTTAAETIRSKNPDASISIITEESNRLYSRVRLPHYLRNEDTLEAVYIRKPSEYEDRKINFVTSEKVVKVDTDNKTVTTNKNNILSWKKLLIATGGKVNKLQIPGSDLAEVVYLRTLKDAENVKKVMDQSKEAVVVGAGFIGMELAQSFVKNGLKTTVVIREKYFWEAVVGENSGKLLTQILEENGVTLLTEQNVTEFVGDGKLASVKLDSGQIIKADIVGVGIGIYLDTDYLKDSGLVIKNGVVTNEFLETSTKDVWAAGDIAEFYDPISKKYHTLGNWSNASLQGRTVGLNMAGEKTSLLTTSLYSISVFGINFSFLGDQQVDEKTEIIERGTLTEKKLGRLLLRENRIVGASLINLPLDRAVIDRLIKTGTDISKFKDKLNDTAFNLTEIEADQIKE